MKKRVIAVTMMFLLLASASIAQRRPQQEADWDNAPKVVPRTTEEMQTPEFWINRIDGDPDKVVMTPDQIRTMNARNRSNPKPIKDINGDDYNIDRVVRSHDRIGELFAVENPLNIKTFSGDSLRARLETVKDNLIRRNFYDRRQMHYDDDMKQELVDRMNMNNIPNVITPMYGITVKHTLNRIYPTEMPGFGQAQSWLDGFNSASIDVAAPVAILHTSSDGEWCYVRGEISFGWVLAEDLAVAPVKQIADYLAGKDIIVATGYKVPIFSDANFKTYLTTLFIGSNCQLARRTSSGFQVKVPYRAANGSLMIVDGWIKPDAKVSVGYQPFTQRNIINTMFNMLYRPYGWADSNHEFDCCGTVRVVLRTFGIKTGRWTSYELHSTDNVIAFPRNTDSAKKYELLKGHPGGITLVGNAGHICTYLGEVDGNHYVIHQGGYSYKGDDKTYHFRRMNVNDAELDGGSNIGGWTEITTIAP